MSPTIVVVAYNRHQSLERLLQSIGNAVFDNIEEVSLIISIDRSDNPKVFEVADRFIWGGHKKIIRHKENLGLKKHILSCGDLSLIYGSVIMLEDDLVVGPYFYQYAKEALRFYKNESDIAGVSLYSYHYLETHDLIFQPYIDSQDTYFVQTASSWGQAWTKRQWENFKEWFQLNQEWDPLDIRMPKFVLAWPETSWKKFFIRYLVDTNKFFVYPRYSYTTNFGEIGTNEGYKNTKHQVTLTQGIHTNFRTYENSPVKYDAFFEPTPAFVKALNPKLKNYDFEVDLYAQKNKSTLKKEYLLTTRKSFHPVFSYSLEMYPLALNIKYENEGSDILLARTKDVLFDEKLDFQLYRYAYHLSNNAIHTIQAQLPSLKKQVLNQLRYKVKKLF